MKYCGTVDASKDNSTISVTLEEDADAAVHAFKKQFSCANDESSPALSIGASPGNCVQLDSFMLIFYTTISEVIHYQRVAVFKTT
ncbi:MAG: hypothetical protein ACYCSP_12555 [Acidobacteriaceae bacterium]